MTPPTDVHGPANLNAPTNSAPPAVPLDHPTPPTISATTLLCAVGGVVTVDPAPPKPVADTRAVPVGGDEPSAPTPPNVIASSGVEPAGGCTSSGQGQPAEPAATIIRSAAPDPTPFVELRLFAETFYDLQLSRTALEKRIGAAAKTGYVLVDPLLPVLDLAKQNEKASKLVMAKCLRRVAPELTQWVHGVPGIGEHLLGLLLGQIGHPLWAYPHHWEGTGKKRVLVAEEPYQRSLAQLRSYCGVGDPARRRRTGMTATEAAGLGNPRAKTTVYLMAECCMKRAGNQGDRSPYRDVYEQARERSEAIHPDWSDGHHLQHALRVTSKEILRELWVVAHGIEATGTALQEAA